MQCTTGMTLEAFPLCAVKAGAKMGALHSMVLC